MVKQGCVRNDYNIGVMDWGRKGGGGMVLGAKRIRPKIEAKRPVGKRRQGETSCYPGLWVLYPTSKYELR